MDSLLRDQSGETRDDIAEALAKLWPLLQQFQSRRFLLGADQPFEIWICRRDGEPTEDEIQRYGQIGCLIEKKPRMAVLVLSFLPTGAISGVLCHSVNAPTMAQVDYPELITEAERQRTTHQATKQAGKAGRAGRQRRKDAGKKAKR